MLVVPSHGKKIRSEVPEVLEKALFTPLHCLPEQAMLIFILLLCVPSTSTKATKVLPIEMLWA